MIFPVSDTFFMSNRKSFAIVKPNRERAMILKFLFCFLIPIIRNTKDKPPQRIG